MQMWTLALVPLVFLGGLLGATRMLSGLADTPGTCALGECPLTLHESDSGRTFYYDPDTRVTVYHHEPRGSDIKVACEPDGTARPASSSVAVNAPVRATDLVMVREGSCLITGNRLSVTVTVREQ